MATIEVSRTLVKSPPELWAELEGDCLSTVVGEVTIRPVEAERELAWEAEGASGTAMLEPAGWGTKVTLTADVEEHVAEVGLWARLRGHKPEPISALPDMEGKLTELLDSLGSAHRKPFVRDA